MSSKARPKKGKAKPTHLTTLQEHKEFADQVIAYYLPLRHLPNGKFLTARHFKKTGKNMSANIYRLIRRYEKRGTTAHAKRTGRTQTLVRDSALRQKFITLYEDNPNLSICEMSNILGLSKQSITRYFNRIRREQEQMKSMNATLPPTDEEAEGPRQESNLSQCQSANGAQLQLFKWEDHEAFGELDTAFVDTGFLEHSFQDETVEEIDIKPDLKSGESISRSAEFLGTGNLMLKRKRMIKNPTQVSAKCLVCKEMFYYDFPQSTVESLESNCDVIFLLRKVLKIETDELQELMELSKGQNLTEWLRLCDTCKHFQEEARSIRSQYQELELRMKRCREKMIVEMKVAVECKKKRTRSRRVKSKTVADRLRDLVMDTHVGQEVVEPDFDAGDKQAEDLARVRYHTAAAPASANVEFSQQLDSQYDEGFDNNEEVHPPSPMREEVDDMCESKPGATPTPSIPIPVNATSAFSAAVKPPRPTLASLLPPDFEVPLPNQRRRAPAICDICGEVIVHVNLSTHKLKAHNVVMEGLTVIKCEEPGCAFKTFQRVELKRHQMRRHEAERPYVCQFCSKRFGTSSEVKDHEDIHRNKETKPYICDLCGARFAVRAYLAIHNRRTHQQRRPPSSMPKKRKTSKVEKGFSATALTGNELLCAPIVSENQEMLADESRDS